MRLHALASTISPSATKLIRLDHTHVLTAFHRYQTDSAPAKKLALATLICRALEVHATIEEEIFYPAMQRVTGDADLVSKSIAEHEEMRRLIVTLRSKNPTDSTYDATLFALMRDVLHHVADEETTLLPDAEVKLGAELGSLGAAMTERKLELLAPKTGEVVAATVRGYPAASALIALSIGLLGAHVIRYRHRRFV